MCNTPDVLSVTTAETALLLILAAARRAGEGERLIRAGRWQGWAPTQLLGVGVVRAPAWASSAWAGSGASWRGWRAAWAWRSTTATSRACRRSWKRGAIFHDDDASFLDAVRRAEPERAGRRRRRGTG